MHVPNLLSLFDQNSVINLVIINESNSNSVFLIIEMPPKSLGSGVKNLIH